MKSRNGRDHSNVATHKKGFFRWIYDRWSNLFGAEKFTVTLKGENSTLYPGMSRGEIKRVAQAICRAAVRNAE